MQLAEICLKFSQIESDYDVNSIKLNDEIVWPILRYCLWVDLVRPSPANQSFFQRFKTAPQQVSRLRHRLLSSVFEKDLLGSNQASGPTVACISWPNNLQFLPDQNLWIDRVFDPIIWSVDEKFSIEKLYASEPHFRQKLNIPAPSIFAALKIESPDLSNLKRHFDYFASCLQVSAEKIESRFNWAYKSYLQWRKSGTKLLQGNPQITVLCLSCWYYPASMGLIAAASSRGVLTVDVQHGKQGRHQAMYSWWTKIPCAGYTMMPDRFWCWGEQSCSHILCASPDRKNHQPFVGGNPWPTYYLNNFSDRSNKSQAASAKSKQILFTMQSPIASHTEPIPDFLIDHLRNPSVDDLFVTFRCHPNYIGCETYSESRLRDVPSERYRIDNSGRVLFDELQTHTHHMTAFSSCSYEAELFDRPTLLFGQEALTSYGAEIEEGRFSWTQGTSEDIDRFLCLQRTRGRSAKYSDVRPETATAAIEMLVETVADGSKLLDDTND